MAFLFSKSENPKDKNFLLKTIKSNLALYCKIVNEPIDYAVGDYVVIKPEALKLNLSKNDLAFGYVVEINSVQEDKYYSYDIRIITILGHSDLYLTSTISYLFHKGDPNNAVLKRFVDDKSIEKNVAPGSYVRGRNGYMFYINDHSKMTSYSGASRKNLLMPCIVRNNENGKITLAAYAENDDTSIVEKISFWYELAPYTE